MKEDYFPSDSIVSQSSQVFQALEVQVHVALTLIDLEAINHIQESLDCITNFIISLAKRILIYFPSGYLVRSFAF